MQKERDFTVLFMGTYPPRECGIATFTKDLTDAVDKRFFPRMKSKILAINKNGTNIYNYPKKVLFQISDNDINDYLETAKKINLARNISLVCVQHEFGIFGGEYGDHLLAFLEVLEKPAVLTFHSVLPSPNERLKKVTKALSERVKEIIVMTKKGLDILRRDYDITTPIKVIPHGIPTVTFEEQKREKKNLGLENKTVLSSFGLVNQGKGFEHVINALPDVVKKNPNVVYLIVGETHPVVRKEQGEEYRNFLERRVKELNLQNHVKFYNKYLTIDEIIKYLKATDIYISSGLDPNQITSGTLSYAMGCGRAVISTQFLHAKDAVKKDKGILVEFENPKAFTEAINYLIKNPDERTKMEKVAYHHTRHMTWPNVSLAYGKVFREVLAIQEINNLPRVNTSHMLKLTDDFGIIQFAQQNNPDAESGYTLDDNARAMIVSAMHYANFKEFKTLKLVKIYLDYIKFVQQSDGKMYNLVSRERRVILNSWSEDAHGRAIWALGHLIGINSIPEDLKEEAEKILKKAFPITSSMQSPRAIAFSIIGMCEYNKSKKSENFKKQIKKLADWLVEAYRSNSRDDWKWFEPYLTYSNSAIPESLFYAYESIHNKNYLKVAEPSLRFLLSNVFENETFVPIGHRGWFNKGGTRAYFDQQPIEAAHIVQTLLKAYGATSNKRYKKYAVNAFQWFLGKNLLNQVIYNETTGGCHDGLGESTININQGAESTLSYLIARLSLSGV